MEFGIFKEILSDPPIEPGDDFRHDDSSAQVLESSIAKALIATRLAGVEKKRLKKRRWWIDLMLLKESQGF